MKRVVLLTIIYAFAIAFCILVPSAHKDVFGGIRPDYIGVLVSGHIFARWTLAALTPAFVSGIIFEINKRIKPLVVIRLGSYKTYVKMMLTRGYISAVIWSLMVISVQYFINREDIVDFAALFTASQIVNVSIEGVIYFAVNERHYSLIIFPLLYTAGFYVCERNPMLAKYSIASMEMFYRSGIHFEYGFSIPVTVTVFLTSSILLLAALRGVLRWRALL